MCFLSRGADLVRTPFSLFPLKQRTTFGKTTQKHKIQKLEWTYYLISCKDFPSILHNKNRVYALLYSYA